MKLLVTGGAGFIGSHLVKNLVRSGHEVTVVDNLIRGNVNNLDKVKNDVEFLKIDILDYNEMKNVVKNIEGVFHEAALGSVPQSFKQPEEYHRVNVNGTETIFKLAKEFGFKVVYASSSSVYGNPTQVPIKEDFERNPINPYGESKLKAEQLAEKYSKQGVKIIVLRYFNVYGIGQNKNYAGVIPIFMENLANKKSPIIFGDGSQVRNFTFVEDVVEANILALNGSVDHAFINIASGVTISINELAKTMIRLSGLSIKPVYEVPREGDIKISQADITLAKKLLGWKPKTTLEEGLRKIFPKI